MKPNTYTSRNPQGILQQIQLHGQDLAFNMFSMASSILGQANRSQVLMGAYAGLQGFMGVYTKVTKGALEKYSNSHPHLLYMHIGYSTI